MTVAFSLAHLTVLGLPPPDMVRVAARTGYQTVGLRLIRATDTTPCYPLMDDPAALRETKAAMADTGVGVLDIEFVRITPEFDVAALEPFLAAGAELGARHVIAAPYDPDHARLADRLGALAGRAAPYGLRPVLEFFPWTSVPDLATAAAVAEAAGSAASRKCEAFRCAARFGEAVGILVDALHFDRSGSTVEQLDRIPPARLPFLHLCDAPVRPPYTTEELLHAGRAERLPPGEGGIDLRRLLAHMPGGIPVALEVPMTALTAKVGAEAVALRARQAAGRLLGA